MNLLKKILAVFLLCLAVIFTNAQQLKNVAGENNYRAVHWGVENGLSEGTTYAMIKDAKGFMWIGTEHGLNRFDGSGFKNYFADKTSKKNSIPNNSVHGLIEDSLHNIWIGTGNGLSRYNIIADNFMNFSTGIPAHRFWPFWATVDEIICLHSTGNKELRIE